jgi:DNA-directed RNA polymerase specialized sigma24 family protein
MSFGDILYILAMLLFAFMTFTIIRNNFLSKFDEQERRKDLVDEYEDEYVSDNTPNKEDKELEDKD